jgi:hypothetical protein
MPHASRLMPHAARFTPHASYKGLSPRPSAITTIPHKVVPDAQLAVTHPTLPNIGAGPGLLPPCQEDPSVAPNPPHPTGLDTPPPGSHPLPSRLFGAAQSHQAQVPALYASGVTRDCSGYSNPRGYQTGYS